MTDKIENSAGPGRKPFIPTETERRQVDNLVKSGFTQKQIAPLVRDGISRATLQKYFAPELSGAMYGGIHGGRSLEPTEVDRQCVEALAANGLRDADIAPLVMGGIGITSLRKHFRRELQRGKATSSLKIAETLYKKATVDEDIAALIWWTKSQMGWKAARDEPKDAPESAPVERIERVVVQQTSP